MDVEHFNALLESLTPMIQKENTVMRQAIPARIKPQMALKYIATGVSYRYLQACYRISRAAISLLIPEVTDAIYVYLKHYVKGTNSVVLMAVVDHDYCFRYVNIGANERNSDSGIFRNSALYSDLENNILPTGGFLVGDDAFALKTYLLKPYSGTNLTRVQKIFNYRLSRARRIVENGFGILTSSFRIFQKPIPTDVNTTDKIIQASCALHNWLRLTSPSCYFPKDCVDVENIDSETIVEGTWRRELIATLPSITDQTTNNSPQIARNLRDKYVEYFSGAGAVVWQA
ncbi:unnamed protein product [Acanthoscelides obtectus]|uniref:DDE Tnp4 domain-containing protein n=1 Tax=Acanthoscelides obtectus TaxID=200917 RepID=A0A9P0MCZ2_ACAOB|nr:unnamed protein product [Acanthoscelides obtectus]CAK1671939.1 Protein ALP1-like [Acanthoscelides obtectus]